MSYGRLYDSRGEPEAGSIWYVHLVEICMLHSKPEDEHIDSKSKEPSMIAGAEVIEILERRTRLLVS